MGLGSKGWHNESIRHSQAKRFGKASGGKVSAPKGVKSISGTKKKRTKVSNSTMWRDVDKASWEKQKRIRGTKKLVCIGSKELTSSQVIKFHNAEARRSLKKGDFVAYRFHKREASIINQKEIALRMKGK